MPVFWLSDNIRVPFPSRPITNDSGHEPAFRITAAITARELHPLPNITGAHSYLTVFIINCVIIRCQSKVTNLHVVDCLAHHRCNIVTYNEVGIAVGGGFGLVDFNEVLAAEISD